MTSKPCGIFLCQFQDTVEMPKKPISFFRKLFLKNGAQSLNDYWKDVSLNSINLDGTDIFDWRILPITLAQFKTQNPTRYDKIWRAAGYFGVDLKKYSMLIVITNGNVEDAGSHGGVLVNFDAINHTFIAHEMGHNFGLGHSFDLSNRKNSSWSAPGEYFDPYDIMSAMAVNSNPHDEYGSIGPNLCAHFVNLQGWMPQSRVWKPQPNMGSFIENVTLVSMSHSEQPGYMMAQFGDYTVEFRTQDYWDAGISKPCILIHQISNNVPYIIASTSNQDKYDWSVGETWSSFAGKSPSWRFHPSVFSITVNSFDLENFTANISLGYTPGRIINYIDPDWNKFRKPVPLNFEEGVIVGQDILVDGGGYLVLNGKVIKIPAEGPVVSKIEKLAEEFRLVELNPI